MKAINLLILSLLISFSGYSQDATADKAKAILDKVSAKTKTFTTIRSVFSFEMENQQEKINEKSVGKIWIKGEKYKLELMGVTTFCDGKLIWSYMKEDKEVNISEVDLTDDKTLNPAKVFTMYQKGFKYKFVKEVFEDTRALYVIDLIPTNFDGEFSKIRLQIDKSENTIYSMKRYGNDGNIYTIKIKNMEPNTPLDDAMFKFDKTKYPGVEVIDTRE
jgi:outer membrane lipoprotein-sorting protein